MVILDDWGVMFGRLLKKKGVSLERLLSFCDVADAGGLASAAKGDPVRQSLMSRQLGELETALEVTLFNRSVRPHELTGIGEELVSAVRDFVREFEAGVSRERGEREVVTVAAGESVILWLLIPLLGRRRRMVEDGMSFRFRNMRSRAGIEAVRAGQADVALHNEIYASKDLESVEVGRYGMRLVGREGLLPGKGVVSWRDLSSLSVALLNGGSMGAEVSRLLTENSEGPELFMECTSHHQVLEVCCELGVTGVVPETAVKRARKMGLDVRKVKEFSGKDYVLVASWQKERARGGGGVSQFVKWLGC